MRDKLRDKLRELGFDELRALYSQLTGEETTVGLAANTEVTKAAAFRRLVVKLDRLLQKAADAQGLPAVELLDSHLPYDVTASIGGKVVATGKVHVTVNGSQTALDLEPEPTPVNGKKGLVRPCVQCGATGLHKCCKRCDVSATGEEEVERVFGFRKLTNKRTGEQTVRPQPWCRDCRSETALAGQRAKRAARQSDHP